MGPCGVRHRTTSSSRAPFAHLQLSVLFQLVSGCLRCPHFPPPLPLELAFLLALFKFVKAALDIHQAKSHLHKVGDILRQYLAGARVDLAMPRRNLGLRTMRYGTSPAQFR
jgi:hypothetical protein